MPSEDLDIEQPGVLTAYLREQELIGADEAPRVTVLAGGVSNRTVLVERESGEAWVVKQALAKLRVTGRLVQQPGAHPPRSQGLVWLDAVAPHGTITRSVFEDHGRPYPGHEGRSAAPRELEGDAAARRARSGSCPPVRDDHRPRPLWKLPIRAWVYGDCLADPGFMTCCRRSSAIAPSSSRYGSSPITGTPPARFRSRPPFTPP